MLTIIHEKTWVEENRGSGNKLEGPPPRQDAQKGLNLGRPPGQPHLVHLLGELTKAMEAQIRIHLLRSATNGRSKNQAECEKDSRGLTLPLQIWAAVDPHLGLGLLPEGLGLVLLGTDPVPSGFRLRRSNCVSQRWFVPRWMLRFDLVLGHSQ